MKKIKCKWHVNYVLYGEMNRTDSCETHLMMLLLGD